MPKLNTTTSGIITATLTADSSPTLELQENGVTISKLGVQPAFSAYQSTAQTLSSATLTKITFDTEEYDTNSNFASSRFTPTVAGYYLVSGHAQPNASYTAGIQAVYKNGALYRYGSYNANATGVAQGAMTCLVYCNGTSDYIEYYASFTSGQDTAAVSNAGTFAMTWFQGHLARAA
jgi:hypothetical protein